ncbi:MAG: cell division protein FtsZ [Bacteroidales bacterium]
MEDDFVFVSPKNQSSIIKVIGVGGGGSNAVNHMYKQGITGVDFIVCNTDQQALEMSPVPNKIHLGKKGLGAGSIPLVGKKGAEEKADEIRDLMGHNTEMLFITAGMGGGTGTGAAPVIARLAKEIDLPDEDVPKILTVAIVTIPFAFEGRKRKTQATEGINELRKYCDAVLIISNDKLRQLFGDLPLSKAFAKADNVLLTAAKGIAEIITEKAYVNIDFKDVNTVMRNSGVAIMGTGIAEGENRARKAIDMALTSPLLNDNEINGTDNILLYLSSGAKELSMDEITDITEYIIEKAGSEVEIIWGAGQDESLEDSIAVTVVATGFDKNELEGNKKRVIHVIGHNAQQEAQHKTVPEEQQNINPKKIQLVNKNRSTDENDGPSGKRPDNPEAFDDLLEEDKGIRKVQQENAPPPKKPIEQPKKLFEDLNNPEINPDHHTEKQPKKHARRSDEMEFRSRERQQQLRDLSMKIKSPAGLAELERQPAYIRRDVKLSDSTPSEESNVSRYSLEEGKDNKAQLKSDNPFLHDNVD